MRVTAAAWGEGTLSESRAVGGGALILRVGHNDIAVSVVDLLADLLTDDTIVDSDASPWAFGLR